MSNLHQHQAYLEQLYNKNQLIPRIRQEFEKCEQFDFVGYIESKNLDKFFGLDLLVQMALHKRCNLPTLVAILDKHFDDVQYTTDQLLKAAEADLVDWSNSLKLFIVKFTISADVQEELDRYQFPLPMVVPPKQVKNNSQTGYFTPGGSIILKKNHHSEDVCLDHINRVNKTQFVINQEVATLVKNQWRNLDKPKEGESREDFDRRKKAFEKYDRTAREVIQTITAESPVFYLTHKYDKRGRTYCQGYHVNYQGAPWNKAVVQFAKQELVE
jgi:DNA-directed RNA polymerase